MNRKRLMAAAAAALCVGLGGVGICSTAHAQAWTPDRKYTEGPGIRAGDLEIHPGIAVRGGYDTNVFKADGDTSGTSEGQPVEGAAILGVTPHVNMATKSQQRAAGGEDRGEQGTSLPYLAFRAGLSATYLHYFADNAPKNVEVDADAWLNLLPQRPVNLELTAAYQRSIKPFAPTNESVGKDDYTSNAVRPGAKLNFQTRSGVLSSYVGYMPNFTLYKESSVFHYMNNFQHTVEAGAGWKFLPNTALIYDFGFSLQDYRDDQDPTAPVLYSDNSRIRTRLGANGAITKTLSMRVMAGYAAFFVDQGLLSEHEDVIGEVALTQKLGARHKLELGYVRDVSPSTLGSWLRSDRARALLGLDLGSFGLSLEGGYSYLTYGRIIGPTGASISADGGFDRNDHRVDGAIRAEYQATNWLAFNADATATAVITDFDYAVAAMGAAPFPDPAGYVAFTFFGGVRAHY